MFIEKKELVASALAALFVVFFVIKSISDMSSMGFGLFHSLSTLGMALILCQLVFMPNMFFLPFMKTFKTEMATLFLSRKAVSLIGILGFVLFAIGFLGARIF